MTKILFQRSSVLALALGLAACGGGGGGVATTPTPPPPPPPPPPVTYTKLADLTGNQTFQSAGLKWDVDLSGAGQGFTNMAVQNFGAGPVLAYDATADSFTVTPTGGASSTFTQAHFVPSDSATGREVFEKSNGPVIERLQLIVPSSGTVSLSYASFAIYTRITNGNVPTFMGHAAVGGAPTVQRDVPTTGTANYTMGIGGSAFKSGVSHTLDGNSTATFAANFGAGTISTAITVAGRAGPPGNTTQPLINFGTATGSGTIASGGPAFNGAFQGTGDITSGQFSGAFFGPQALEAAYEFFLQGTGFSAVGAAAGIKAP